MLLGSFLFCKKSTEYTRLGGSERRIECLQLVLVMAKRQREELMRIKEIDADEAIDWQDQVVIL